MDHDDDDDDGGWVGDGGDDNPKDVRPARSYGLAWRIISCVGTRGPRAYWSKCHGRGLQDDDRDGELLVIVRVTVIW